RPRCSTCSSYRPCTCVLAEHRHPGKRRRRRHAMRPRNISTGMAVLATMLAIGLTGPVESQEQKPGASPPEVVVYASDLPTSALFAFEVGSSSMSARGRMSAIDYAGEAPTGSGGAAA